MSESVTATFMFTDLVGSTRMRDRLGDDVADRLSAGHDATVRDALRFTGGTEVKTLGDGVMAVFESAAEAVACAVRIQEAMAAVNASALEDHRTEVRIGINTGEVVRQDGDYAGLPVAVASRVCNAAEGGQIVTTDLVRALVGTRGGFKFAPLGARTLKGVQEPIDLFEVVTSFVNVALLGSLEVHLNGRPVELDEPMHEVLFAALALHANQTVPADRLVEAIWGDDPPSSALGTVGYHISELRDLLGDAAEGLTIVSESGDYRLDVPSRSIDVLTFDSLVGEGRAALTAGLFEESCQTLDSAILLWRGDALADFRQEAFAQADIHRLEELKVSAIEARFEAKLALGQGPELVAALEEQVDLHPLRERLWAALMLALYRSERQADALRAHGRATSILDRELGLAPGPQLRDLELAILGRDPALRTGPDQGHSVPAAPSRGIELPESMTSFVGRVSHLDEVETLLGDGRLLTLTGPAGCGKSRLALEAARRLAGNYANGACGDTRRRVPVPDLEALGTVRGILSVYGDARLLSFDRDPTTRTPTVEVAHEALLTEWDTLRA